MRELSFSIACLLLLGLPFSCKKNEPEAVKPVIIGSLQLKQQSGTDCNIADTLDRMDCARLILYWPKVEQGSEALKKSVDQWAIRYLGGMLGLSTEGLSTEALTVDAAGKAFFEEHKKTERSVMSGGWVAESNYQVLLNDGKHLTLEITGYTYQGGAHGNTTAAVATFNVLTGKQLGWDDLVTDQAALKTLAERKFRETRADIFKPIDGIEAFDFDEFTPFALAQSFGLTPEGIYCHYVPYEVGPYAIGSTQMTISFAELGALAKVKSLTPAPAVSPAPKGLGNNLKFDFPHFGSFDLSTWNQMPSKTEAGGDVEIETAIYKKDGVSLEIDTVQSSYGYKISHTLIGANGKISRIRTLEFSTDPNAVAETVNDYTVTPAKKYTRSQPLTDYYGNLNPLPTMASGKWTEGRGDRTLLQSGKSTKPEDNAKPAPAKNSKPKVKTTNASPTVTLKQNGDILINGKAVADLESLRKQLQAHLLTYAAIPEKVNFKPVGQTGMGMRAEINTIIAESVAGAKWVRKKAAITALNAAVGKKLGMPTQLVLGSCQTSGSFAYISARPTQADGRAIDYSRTDYAQDRTAAWFSDNAIGLLRYQNGAWSVQAYTIGVQKAPVSNWVKKFNAPKSIFGK